MQSFLVVVLVVCVTVWFIKAIWESVHTCTGAYEYKQPKVTKKTKQVTSAQWETPKPNAKAVKHVVTTAKVEEQGYTMSDQDILNAKQRSYMKTRHW